MNPQNQLTPARGTFPALIGALCLAALLGAGCQGYSYASELPEGPTDPVDTPETPAEDPATDPVEDPTADSGTYPSLTEEWVDRLGEREVDYSAALRTASMRLRGVPPTLLEIRLMANASDPASTYRSLLEGFMDDPAFARQIVDYYRDTFKIGGDAELDSAAFFAAQLVVEDRNYDELLTASSGTCPTFDAGSGTFTPGNCDNNVPEHAGLLTHPGVQRHYYGNLAFRRLRFVQETFVCNAMSAETGNVEDVGADVPYTSPWPFASIAGEGNGGRVDFLDTESVVCANCHGTMNHQAPLFAYFDEDGRYNDSMQVLLPSDGSPTARMSDYLPDGEVTAWRFGTPARNLPEFGAAMVADASVHQCTVARMWNWAMGRGDIVEAVDTVPTDVIEGLITSYRGEHNNRIKPLLMEIFTSDDFIRF